MKICRIVYTYSPYSLSGGDIYAEKIQRALTSAYGNNSAVIITINPKFGDVIEERHNTKIYRFHPFNISTFHKIGRKTLVEQGIWSVLDVYSLYCYLKIKNILKMEKPDVVHCHTPVDITLSAIDAVKSLKLPLVWTLHDYILLCRRFVLIHGSGRLCTDKNENPLCRIYRGFSKSVIDKKADIVIAPTMSVLDMHKKYGFFKDTRTVVLPHGIELENKAMDFNHKPDGEGFNISYAGGLTKPKGVHVLIKAFRRIDKKNIKLHIAGYGIYDNTLKSLAGDDPRIVFYGRIPNDDIKKIYKLAQVSVVPSIWHDVRPNVIPEAFKEGIPVIGSDIGGIPELIKDNYNGFLFKAGDEDNLKEVLEYAIENPERLIEMGRNAYESVKEFEMSKYVGKLMSVYEEAIRINDKKNRCRI